MTRINLVDPATLCDKHLIAEYRELPRIFKIARKCDDAPKEYTLGSGHVKFFYNKLHFLMMRFYHIVDELEKRGFKIKYKKPPVNDDVSLYGPYKPTQKAINLNSIRIALSLLKMTRNGIKQ